jgi:hypothetical protein
MKELFKHIFRKKTFIHHSLMNPGADPATASRHRTLSNPDQKTSTPDISAHRFSSVTSRRVSSRLVSSHLISFRHVAWHRISLRRFSSRLASPRRFSLHPAHLVASHIVLGRPVERVIGDSHDYLGK